MYKYIDVHTHKSSSKEDILSIVNIRLGEKASDEKFFSMGLHPWHIEKISADEAFKMMSEAFVLPNCLAAGEAGIDKLTDVSIEFQQTIFERQLQLADNAKLPVIIHNVRSLQEILYALEKSNFKYPFIFHGFTGSPEMAQQIINAGGYLSFGNALLNKKNVQQTFVHIPANRFFLETDDSDCEIHEIYDKTAELRNINLHDLQNIIIENTRKVFLKLSAIL